MRAIQSYIDSFCTAHKDVDYELVRKEARLIVDTRNVFRGTGDTSEKIFKA